MGLRETEEHLVSLVCPDPTEFLDQKVSLETEEQLEFKVPREVPAMSDLPEFKAFKV